ncbi:PIF1 [Branchiostoma lanceolatum]|uniref:ATP-dependent DNA helicase n=1 Tax=Branchiostoma lanceolatum TaxID=7740 RepID=A0A8S4MNQ2_BRALA|nr:PIF1 [Branchiostoma lanceolatum]
MVSLSSEQLHVCNLANDFNIFVSGRAGSGKSVVLRHIIANMVQKYGEDSVAVVAPNGKAAVLINGKTINSFFSLGLGQKEATVVLRELDTESHERISKVQVLVCDEVSMLSSAIFQKVHRLLQMVKQNRRPFGGVRLVLAGDFFQLPPVDLRDDSTPDFCFLDNTWQEAVDLCLFLTGVHRQDNPQYLQMLEQMRMGRRTPECLSLIEKLTRPLPRVDVRLYSLRQDMNVYNEQRIAAFEGIETRYVARDSGPSKGGLDKLCQAPRVLVLKKGAPVVLLQNLFSISPNLVNGCTGIVKDFSNGKPLITFQTGETHIIKRHVFPYYDEGQFIAARSQLPLQLGFSMTVHKSQGSSISHLEIVDVHMFAPGQQYTAYTRAISPDSLRVLPGYSKHVIKPHPLVLNFYDTRVRVLQDLVVPCISKCTLSCEPQDAHVVGNNTHDTLDSQTLPSIPIPDGYDTKDILKLLREDIRPNFKNKYDVVMCLDYQKESLQSLIAYLILSIEEWLKDKTFDKKRGKEVTARKTLTSHILKIYEIAQDGETHARWRCVLSEINIPSSRDADKVLVRLVTVIHRHITNVSDIVSDVKEKLKGELAQMQPNTRVYNASKANCGKVRYLMGWAVYRVLINIGTKLQVLKKQKLTGKKAMEAEAKIKELQTLKAICCDMRSDQINLNLDSKYKYSLEHFNRKNKGGLFGVSDNIFLFGMALESLCGKLFRVEVSNVLGKEATSTLSKIVKDNQILKGLFVKYLNNEYIPDVDINLTHIPVHMEDPVPMEGDIVHIEGDQVHVPMVGDPVHTELDPVSMVGDPVHTELDPVSMVGDPVHTDHELDPVSMVGDPVHTELDPVSMVGDPVHTELDPVSMVGDPVDTEGETVSMVGDPVHTELDPVSMVGDPVDTDGDPVHIEGDLVHIEGNPVHIEGDPVHTDGDPVHIEGDPVHTDEDPVHIEGGPVHTDGDPVHIEGEPVHIEGDPVHTDGDPVHMEVDDYFMEGDDYLFASSEASPRTACEPLAWSNLCDLSTISEQTKEKLGCLVIDKYLNMRNKEFARRVSEKVNAHKETALRPALQAKSKKSSLLTFTSFLEDKTDAKEYTHLHLKALAVKGADSLTIFTVAQIKLFLLCYGKKTKSTSKKDLMRILCTELKSTDRMLHSHCLSSKNLEIFKKGKVPETTLSGDPLQGPDSVEHGSVGQDQGSLQPHEGATSVNDGHVNLTVERTENRHTTQQRAKRFSPTEEQIEILRNDHVTFNGNPVHLHQTRANQFGVLPSQIKRWHTSYKKRSNSDH